MEKADKRAITKHDAAEILRGFWSAIAPDYINIQAEILCTEADGDWKYISDGLDDIIKFCEKLKCVVNEKD